MLKSLYLLATTSGFLAVALGAFGSHALKTRLSDYHLGVWETANQYQFYHTFALLAALLVYQRMPHGLLLYSGGLFVAGMVIFSGSLYVLAVTDIKVLGAITPLGGALLAISLVIIAYCVYKITLDKLFKTAVIATKTEEVSVSDQENSAAEHSQNTSIELAAQSSASEAKPNRSKRQKKRHIRSFVRRAGRMTKGQSAAYERLLPRFGLQQIDGLQDFAQVFERSASLNVEIGFGMGDSLAQMALAAPHENFIGIEVHAPGVGRLLELIDQHQLENIRIYEEDAIEVLRHCFAPQSIDRLQIYFPDPWHKKKHHKRRLIQNNFLDLVQPKMVSSGQLHIATDWQPYAEQVVELMAQRPDFKNLSTQKQGFISKPEWRPETKFERRGLRLGHGVYDLLYTLA